MPKAGNAPCFSVHPAVQLLNIVFKSALIPDPMSGHEQEVVKGAAQSITPVILRAALENWLAHGVPIGAHPRRRTRLRNNGHDRLHCRRERDGPLQRLHATHRQPGDGEKLVYAKDVSSEPVLGSKIGRASWRD